MSKPPPEAIAHDHGQIDGLPPKSPGEALADRERKVERIAELMRGATPSAQMQDAGSHSRSVHCIRIVATGKLVFSLHRVAKMMRVSDVTVLRTLRGQRTKLTGKIEPGPKTSRNGPKKAPLSALHLLRPCR